MEPAKKKVVVDGATTKLTVYGTSIVDIAAAYYASVGYDPLLILRRLVAKKSNYELEDIESIADLESWLHSLLQSKDRELRAVVLKLLSRVNKMQDPVGAKLVEIQSKTYTPEPPSEDDEEDDVGVATKTLSNLSLSAKYSPILVDEDYFAGPDDTEMRIQNATPQSPPRVTPARTPSGSKRPRQDSPLKDTGEYKRAKQNGKKDKARSSWVMDEEVQIGTSPEESLVESVLEAAQAYDDKAMWEYLFHVPVELSDDTVELSNDFSNDEFWEWFNQIEDFFDNAEDTDFDFAKARAVSKNKDLKGERLIDAVVDAGNNK